MTKLYRFFKAQLLLVVVLLSATMGFAQVVQVPANCNVINVGPNTVGGVLGAGGKVGNGGIVGMADPSPGGTFTFIPPLGAVIDPLIKWQLLGDLSSTTTTPNYGAPTQPANGTTATILSYNKKERPSESGNYTLARSKGRVTVSYAVISAGTFTCGSSISFDIFKTFTTSPPIVGPDCVVIGQPVTFSVDQVASDNAGDAIGFDSYYWSNVPQNSTFYYSADNSSITFTPTALTGTPLKVCLGKLNASIIPSGPGPNEVTTPFTTYSTCATKPLNELPKKPVLTIPNLCVSTNTTLLNFGFTNAGSPTDPLFISTYTYTWSNVGNLWSITPVVGQPGQWNFNRNGDNNPGILTLIINNNAGCLPVTYTYDIKRTFTTSVTPFFGIIGSNCISQNQTPSNYALSAVANLNAVTWSSTPAGLQLTNGTGAQLNTVNVVAPSTAPVGRYTLTATSAAPCAGSVSFTIDVRPPTPTFTTATTPIVGSSPSCVIRNNGFPVTFTCTPITVAAGGVANYLWGIPAGWTLAGGSVNPSSVPQITLLPGGTAVNASLSINARVSNAGVVSACTSSGTNGFTVNYNPVVPTGVTLSAGCFTTGIIGTKTLTISNPQNFGSYVVTSNPVGLIGAAAPTIAIVGSVGTITFPTTGASGTYAITVTHRSFIPALPAPQIPICGVATSTAVNVTIAANTAAWAASFPAYDPTVGGSDTYRVNTQPAGTTYQWFYGPTPATLSSTTQLVAIPFPNSNPLINFSPSGNQLSLFGNAALGLPQVYCIVTPGGGCPVAISAPKGTHGIANRGINASQNVSNEIIEAITVYPNPNNGNFVINLDKDSTNARATLFDNNGKQIGVYTLSKGETRVEKAGLAAGNYILVLDLDSKTETRQLLIK